MDKFSLYIQSKMSKIERLLLDLDSEIFIAIQYLVRLRENSNHIVQNLNSITVPANYLKDFMDVNSFILKYLSFLTEINCKFEMLKMSERAFANTKSISKAIISEVIHENLDKLNSSISTESILEVKLNESDVDSNKVIVEQISESEASLCAKSLREKKLKKKKSKLNSKNSQNSCNKSTLYCDNDNIEKINEVVDNNANNIDNAVGKVENNSNTKSIENNFFEEDTSVVVKDDLQCISGQKNYVEPEIACIDKKLDSKAFVSCKNKLVEIKVEESRDSFPANDSASPICDSPCKSGSNIFLSTEIQLSVADIPVAEVVPTKNNERRFISGLLKDLDCSQSFKCERQNIAYLNEPVQKNNGNKINDIKPANVMRKLGEEYDVTIEHIKSPSEFYVSFTKDKSLFLELEKKLKVILGNKTKITNKKSEKKKALLSKEIGTHALFYSKCDETWCRAKVTNWCLNFLDNFVNIFLIDYGESKCVSVDDLIPMPECFKQYPAFTQRCHLHGVLPLDMNKDGEGETFSWEKESSEKMKFLTENSTKMRIKLACDDYFHEFASLPVTLWLVDQGNQCVNELLVKSKCAIQGSVFDQSKIKSENVDERTKEDGHLNDWNPMKEDFESYENLYDFDISDPAALIYGYVGKDYERICPHFAKTGYCFKGKTCRKEHEKLDPLGFTTDQEEIYKNAFNVLKVPPTDILINVQVTCLLSMNQFYCIPKDRSLSYSDEENLQSLLNFMNAVENLREMKKLLIPPSTGQIVIAQYSDGLWYRARILESEPEKDSYKVMFVDYGNKEILSLSHIRAIEARYLHLPFQAMHCFIFGIDRNPKITLQEVMDYLHCKMYDDYISIEVVAQFPGDYISLLVHVFDTKGRNVGDDLIEKNYAILKEEIVISNHSSSVPG